MHFKIINIHYTTIYNLYIKGYNEFNKDKDTKL